MQCGGNFDTGFRELIEPLDGLIRINYFQLYFFFQQKMSGLIRYFHFSGFAVTDYQHGGLIFNDRQQILIREQVPLLSLPVGFDRFAEYYAVAAVFHAVDDDFTEFI